MKIRSLLLGSIAAAGLSTGAFAADVPQVLTTLNLCDALGLTGLTISSDTNCLQISGEVKYEFQWGDFKGSETIVGTPYGAFTIIGDDAHAARVAGDPDHDNDWYSKVEAYLKFVGTADTDVGPAKAVIKLKDIYERAVRNEDNNGANDVPNGNFQIDDLGLNNGAGADGLFNTADDIMRWFGEDGVRGTPDDIVGLRSAVLDDDTYIGGDDTGGFVMDEAYVAIGGATVLSAGKKGSIMNKDDDTPFNWLTLFLSEKVDAGVNWTKDLIPDGGHVIQLVHDFGNGLSGKVGLENLAASGPNAGTAVGVLAFAGEKVTAHITAAASGILDGTVENFGVHAGITGTFNILKVRAAVAADNTAYVNALASAQATFDIFTLAWSGEYADDTDDGLDDADYGVGASLGAKVTDGITINVGGRWYHDGAGADSEGWQAAAQVIAAVTETITVTGEVGVYGSTAPALSLVDGTSDTDIYGKLQVAWAPGGEFNASLAGEVHQNGGYKATFKASKTID
jgi:hypothetical protein